MIPTSLITFDQFQTAYQRLALDNDLPPPMWKPTPTQIKRTNLYRAMQNKNFDDYYDFYQWSVTHLSDFLAFTLAQLNIQYHIPYRKIIKPITNYQIDWLSGAKLNITDSCFTAEEKKIAIIYADANYKIHRISYGELKQRTDQLAQAIQYHFPPTTALAMLMPMNPVAIIIYLAIIRAGCVVVSIADSFAPNQIQERLRISQAKALFTQDYYLRDGKKIELYAKTQANSALNCIVNFEYPDSNTTQLRSHDRSLIEFAKSAPNNPTFSSFSANPHDYSNILFSSGTTGTPKAIPWTHTTPIRCGLDGFYHQDIQTDDIVAWPTNLGWMMGPWLVYACLMNHATMALSNQSPTHPNFGRFIQDEKITILGLVPSIVTQWKTSQVMETFNWQTIKCFSSSGECSNPDDYLYLSWLAGNKPIIEYCGGTEIGGAYLTSTLIQPNRPALFTTPALGTRFVLLNPDLSISPTKGEVALIPPSIGLSQTLLNRDHFNVYFADMPKLNGLSLRRHGDQVEKLADDCYRALGRSDDTMNLGGIKTSSVEIERVLNRLTGIKETAAIAIPPKNGGPNQLVIFVVLVENTAAINLTNIHQQFQQTIKEQLNPLFKLHQVVIVNALPRNAANKIMRRSLREDYVSHNIKNAKQ